MIYPNKLEKNDTIKIISPSNGVKKKKIEKFEEAISFLKDSGYSVLEDKYVRCSEYGSSSIAVNRSRELNKSIKDKNVKALIACSGGDYLYQILDSIKFRSFTNNIKWIQGQSDITALLFYITTNFDVATIYNFNAKTYGEKDYDDMLNNSLKFLRGEAPKQIEYGMKNPEDGSIQQWECLNEFVPVEGRIIGGCIDSLKDLIGTKYDKTKKFINKYKNDGIIWYFDVAEMTNEDISRTLWQLKSNGWFKNTKCILFGRLCEEVCYTDVSLRDSIMYNLEDLNIPVIMNADIGHTEPVFTIVNGSIVKITKKDKFIMETKLQ